MGLLYYIIAGIVYQFFMSEKITRSCWEVKFLIGIAITFVFGELIGLVVDIATGFYSGITGS